MLQALIDKQDTFEVVRDKIAYILVQESANQMDLAEAGGKDSAKWDLRVAIERSSAIDLFQNPDDPLTPIVVVSYEGGDFPMSRGDVVYQQLHEAIYNIDIYGCSESTDSLSGDEAAAKEAQRALRLVRNILMSSENTHLGLRGTVGRRWPMAIRSFMPPYSEESAVNVRAIRLQLAVTFNEYSPQYEGEILELVTNTFKRTQDGLIILAVNYEYEQEEQ